MRATLSLSLILAASLAVAQTVTCRGPLSDQQIVDLLQGKVPEARVFLLVDNCGISFSTTQEAMARLRTAGATPYILEALRRKAELQAWTEIKDSKSTQLFEDYLSH